MKAVLLIFHNNQGQVHREAVCKLEWLRVGANEIIAYDPNDPPTMNDLRELRKKAKAS